MDKITIEIDYAQCKYCGLVTFLVNDYGECSNGCPGNFHILFTKEITIPKECVITQPITIEMSGVE